MSLQETEPGTHAIVLAAGAARRFGGGKLSSLLDGRPLITWAVEAALATRAETVIVVVGADAERVLAVLPNPPRERMHHILCEAWEEGLSQSLRCGLDALPSDARAILLFLGDMPHVSSALADRLLQAVLDGAPAAMPVCNGVPAHPVAIASSLFPALRGLTGDKGARSLLEGVPGAVRVHTDDPGSIFDVDRPGDLQPSPPIQE